MKKSELIAKLDEFDDDDEIIFQYSDDRYDNYRFITELQEPLIYGGYLNKNRTIWISLKA